MVHIVGYIVTCDVWEGKETTLYTNKDEADTTKGLIDGLCNGTHRIVTVKKEN